MKIVKGILLIILYLTIYYIFQFTFFVITGIITIIPVIIKSRFFDSEYILKSFMKYDLGNVLCITLILAAPVSFLIYWLIFRKKKLKITEISNFKKIKPSYIIPTVILGITGCIFSSALIELLSKLDFFKYKIIKYEYSTSWIYQTNIVLLILAGVVVAPIIEEILFRGIIFYELKKFSPVLATIIIQGVLFGVYHFNIIQLVYCSLLGILLGLIYNWTKNIWFSIIIHITNNLIALLDLKLINPVRAVYILPISLIIIILICFFFFKKRIQIEE